MPGAVTAFYCSNGNARDQRRGAEFVIQYVAALFDDDLLPRLGVKLNRDLITHRPGRDEQRGFLFKNFRGAFLQSIHRRVFAEDIVPDLRRGHRCTHFIGRFCYGVAAKIDHEEISLRPSLRLSKSISAPTTGSKTAKSMERTTDLTGMSRMRSQSPSRNS